MLYELYEYAISHHLAARPGFKPKRIKAYVCLGMHGEILGIDPGPQEPVICPDMGSAAQGAQKCNILVEKRLIPLSQEKIQKHEFYMNALENAAETIAPIKVLREALQNEASVLEINEKLDSEKIKPGDIIGFKVDGVPLETLVDEWWPSFLEQQTDTKKKANRARCLITGQIETPVQTVAKVSGLRSVGGHSSGDALICFDKDAFCSYGFKKAENASVSDEGMAAVNAALTELIGKAKTVAGAKWVHWYKESLAPEVADPLEDLFGSSLAEETDEDTGEEALLAEARADRLLTSHKTGETVPGVSDNLYYILPLSGAGGRIMVRGWQQGSFQDLQAAMDQWWNDLSLEMSNGSGLLQHPTIGKINFRLLKIQNGGKSVNDRMKEELAGLEPRLIFSILNNTPIPDAAAAKALRYIRSKMLDSGDKDKRTEPIPDPVSCQLLKAWILRKDRYEKRGENTMQETCNSNYPGVGYQCGRLMAVYAAIQSRAMGKNLGAGVIQRYYTSASTTPALVFGRLSQLCQHHLSKIENRGAVIYYENLLSEISEKIGAQLPATLNLRQQAEFSLGYYHQRAAMLTKNTNNQD